MGYELLEYVTALLTAAGLRAGEEYPAGERMQILSPAAAVGLRELDAAAGEARYSVRVLSPRLLGGWCCQVWAARAEAALVGGGMTCETGEMEYLSGCDCFCVELTAAQPVVSTTGGWTAGARQRIFCDGFEQRAVESFRAVREQGRRLVGAHGQQRPVAVTPGSGGWKLELIQWGRALPEELPESFVLAVREGDRELRYTGCCWNEEQYEYTQQGTRLIRRGFALDREEAGDE